MTSPEEITNAAATHALATWFRGRGYATAARLLGKIPFEVADAAAIRADMATHGASSDDQAWADKLLTLWFAADAPVVRELADAQNQGFPRLPIDPSDAPVTLPGVPGVTVDFATDGNGSLAFLHRLPGTTVDPHTLVLALARQYGLWTVIEPYAENTFRAVAGWVEPPARSTYRTLRLPGTSTTPVWTTHSASRHEVEIAGHRVQVLRHRDGNFTRFSLLVASPTTGEFQFLSTVARNRATPPERAALLRTTTDSFSALRDARPAAEALARALASSR